MKPESAVKKLKKKLVKLEFTKDITKIKHRPFDPEEFERLAKAARATFHEEDLLGPTVNH